MWSFIPRPIRKYRKINPYSHPLLFLFVDMIDSTIKMSLVGAALYGSYHWMFLQSDKAVNTNDLSVNTELAAIIDEPEVAQFTTIIDASSSPQKTRSDDVSKSTTQLLLTGTDAARWINGLPEDQFTIQFASSIDKALLQQFANDHLTNGAAIYPFKITSGSETMYGLASGLYKTLPSALKAIDQFPKALLEHSPWIRPVAELQTEVQQATSMRPAS